MNMMIPLPFRLFAAGFIEGLCCFFTGQWWKVDEPAVAMVVKFKRPAASDPETFVWQEGEMPISIKHRDGWCALPEGHVFSEGDTFAPTLCEVTTGKGVNLPGGVERREPDCSDCLLALCWPAGLSSARPGARSRPSGLSERLVTQ